MANLNTKQVAEFLGIKPRTLEAWRQRGPDQPQPPFTRIGTKIVYDEAEVRRWKESRRGWE